MKKQFRWPGKKQRIQERPLDSTGIPKAGSALHPDPDIPASCSLRRTCSEITVGQFRKAHCHGDLSVLIKSGKPSDAELLATWQEIVWELSVLIHTEETSRIFEILKEKGRHEYIIKFVENAVRLLSLRYNETVVFELIQIGFPGDYGKDDIQVRRRQLSRIISLCKNHVFDLEILTDEYNRLIKTNDGKKQSDEDFLKNIVMLKKWGYKLDNDTPVDEYAQAMNLYMRESKIKTNG
jgi:hypothetical protein